ncbi:kinetochore-like protein nuf2 [Elsinoe australis]|uniref:Probable kinetochore protein NUF2 n=1 Tax=Elsinoe australis TaxID=40998 RepID=A0A4U7AU46_9PEZI|nr:kinetochore-like protein nuf2 [Elsinoe australis]
MAYNGRMSMARSSQQSSQGRSKQADDSDAFMTLPDREIAGCISDIGIPFTVADLQKPNPQQIQKVFEWFAELLLNTTRDVVAPGMRAAAESLAGPDDADRIFTADTRELMGFFIMLRRLLSECGVKDFTFSDLYRPTHGRLVRIFSYVINFIRFRESQTGVIDAHFNSLDETKRRIEGLWGENEERRERLEEMRRNKEDVEAAMREKERRSQELKTRLLELKKGQERVAEKLERARAEQGRLKSLLEDKGTQALTVRKEADKLRPYTLQSPAVLEGNLRELAEVLGRDKAEIERLERRDRALKTSGDTFGLVLGDVGSLMRLAGDVAEELRKEEEEVGRANRARDALSERSNNVRDVERQERFLSKQLQSWMERTEKLRRNADEKQEVARKRMEELRGVHEELGRERRTRGDEIERRRIRIETVEKKMADLKENIENEVQSAREEYMKMESHIRLYITEMEQSLV